MGRVLFVALLALSVLSISHAVQMPAWFGDNMILQANSQYGARSFLSGRATPGELVTVRFQPTYNAMQYTAVADTTGFWEARPLPTIARSA